MNSTVRLMLLGCGLLHSSLTTAVSVNPEGLGGVLIYPYDTVNNNLNTHDFYQRL